MNYRHEFAGRQGSRTMPSKEAKGTSGKKVGQQFARLAVGYLERIRRLKQNGPRACHVLSWLLIESKGKESVEISFRRLSELTGLAVMSIQKAIHDLTELTLIEVGSGVNIHGNRSNIYRILPPPPMLNLSKGCAKSEHTLCQDEARPVKKLSTPCAKSEHTPYKELSTPIRIDKQVDGVDIIDGKNSSGKTCFEKIIEALAVIGVGPSMRYKLGVKIHDAGLDDEDVANAGKLAVRAVLGKKTRNSQGLDFTRGLNKSALEAVGAYAIGIIENSIEQELSEITLSPA